MKSDINKAIAAIKSDLELLRRELSSTTDVRRAERCLLEALRRELKFVEEGGYACLPRAPLIFEDSPICPNYRVLGRLHPCADCALGMLIPKKHQEDGIPCRHIPLTSHGETLAVLYARATDRELDWEIREWLRTKIAELQLAIAAS